MCSSLLEGDHLKMTTLSKVATMTRATNSKVATVTKKVMKEQIRCSKLNCWDNMLY